MTGAPMPHGPIRRYRFPLPSGGWIEASILTDNSTSDEDLVGDVLKLMTGNERRIMTRERLAALNPATPEATP